MKKLFISHASHDTPLVEAFLELLETGIGIPNTQVFCSSIKGRNIKPGQNFVQSIRTNLEGAACVIALISEAYYASAFCMCELGAAWALERELKPVVIPPADRAESKVVLAGLQRLKIGDESDLDELHDELIRSLGVSDPEDTARWNKKRDKFLDALPKLLERIAFKGDVPRSTFEKLEGRLANYKDEAAAYEKRLAEKDALIADLKKAKDRTEVKKVVRKHSSAADQFEDLVSEARSALLRLPRPACEALYYEARAEPYLPKQDDWDDVQEAAENGYVQVDEDHGTAMPSTDNRTVEKARLALGKLERWLGTAPDDFTADYTDEHGESPSLTLRGFWRRHLR